MTDTPTPSDTLAALRRRLADLSANRPFRFRETRRSDAEAFLMQRTHVAGCTPEEIAAAEAALGLQLPEFLALFYLQMGRATGGLFVGSDLASIEELSQVTALLPEFASDSETPLPETAICFMTHQGYIAYYTLGTRLGEPRAADAPVLAMLRGETAPRNTAPSVAEYVVAEIGLMEEVHAMQLKQGGYYVALSGGTVRETHPALASGERPIETEDQFDD